MNIYYVYFYLRKDFSPYYVGKGKEKRAWEKHHQGISVPKDKSNIILVEENLTELQAFILERYYIRWFGRKDIETGILRNKTDGGEGTSGKIVSYLTKQKIGNSNKGRIKKPSPKESYLKQANSLKLVWKDKNSKLRSEETKHKISEARIKNWQDDFYRKNKTDSIKTNWTNENSELYKAVTKTYKIFPPKEMNIEPFIITNLTKFYRENGLTSQAMASVAAKKRNIHKGWKCEKL